MLKWRKYTKTVFMAAILSSVCAFAAEGGGSGAATDLAGIAGNIQTQLDAFASLMITVAYLAGIGFGIAAIFKFKQHKDNPTQVPVGTPFALLIVSILLVFLPGIFKPAAKSVFGTDSGFELPGASSGTK